MIRSPLPSRLQLSLTACFLSVAAGTPAQLPSNSLPALIQDERVLIGKYRYVERADGMKIDVEINADRSATYRIRAGADDAEFMEAKGVWTYDGDTLHIHNQPGPVRLEQAAPPARDGKVGLAVSVRTADGSSAKAWE